MFIKDLFLKIRTRTVVKLLLFLYEFLWISLYVNLTIAPLMISMTTLVQIRSTFFVHLTGSSFKQTNLFQKSISKYNFFHYCLFLLKRIIHKQVHFHCNLYLRAHPRVNREVLFIEVSLKCYPEDIFSSCKVWQLQRWENFRHIKLLQLLKAKTCWTKNLWSSGIMSNFWGKFFYVLGGKKFFQKFFKKYCSVPTEKWHKMKLK